MKSNKHSTKREQEKEMDAKRGISPELIRAFIKDYRDKLENEKVAPCIRAAGATLPVVWFGDSAAYFRSKRRIVTVAINPSHVEFGANPPRFDQAALVEGNNVERLRRTLDAYFRTNPYMRWFRHFERVLEMLGASYGDYIGSRDIALHIDMYSAIATNPTWRGLDAETKNLLRASGVDLFSRLLDELKPHLVLCSVAQAVRKAVLSEFGDKPLRMDSEGGDPHATLELFRRKDGVRLLSGTNYRGQPFSRITTNWLRDHLKNWRLLGGIRLRDKVD